MSLLGSSFVFLGAAVNAVSIFKKLKLGAILGYLVAGAAIGPFLLILVTDPGTIMRIQPRTNTCCRRP